MANWNNNGYYTEGWHGEEQRYPPGAPSGQYVGFNDFLHQFQQLPANYPTYPPPAMGTPFPPTSFVPAPGPSYPPGGFIANNTQTEYPSASNNYDKENSSNNSSSNHFPKHNRRNDKKKPLQQDKSGSYDNTGGKEEVASHSKLMATAEEFIPQSARSVLSQVPTKGEPPVPTVIPAPDTNRNQARPGSSQKWKSKNTPKEAINSTNWRSRVEEEPWETESTASAEQASFTVYNSNRPPSQDGGSSRTPPTTQGLRQRRDNANKNFNINEKGRFNQAENRSNVNNTTFETDKSKSKMSFNVNESFGRSHQVVAEEAKNGRGDRRQQEDREPQDDRGQQDNRRGGENKRGAQENKGRRGGDNRKNDNRTVDDTRRGDNKVGGEDVKNGNNRKGGDPKKSEERRGARDNRTDESWDDRKWGDDRRGGENRRVDDGRRRGRENPRGEEIWPSGEERRYGDDRRVDDRDRRYGDDRRVNDRRGDDRRGDDRRGDDRRGDDRRVKGKEMHSKKITARDGIQGVGQRERLAEQLDRGELECLVCCDRVRQADYVWACCNCHHVLHLKCVQKWASTSIVDGQWRCPACQHKERGVPSEYRCFCGARRQPEWVRGTAAHSCGEPCGGRHACATHACTLPCHPGPCPTCDATSRRHCECGATSQLRKCSLKTPLLCGGECGKPLACGAHVCKDKCHPEPCQPCPQKVEQTCYCPLATSRTLDCDASTVGVDGFSCGAECGRKKDCGNHTCSDPCHPGPCQPCALAPKAVTRCPCSQTLLKEVRTSCLDPVPVCDQLCSYPLNCGPPEEPHCCQSSCHHGQCPPCPGKTPVSCRCGSKVQELACVVLEAERHTVRCGKKCTKKYSCGRHKCQERCCVDAEHRCPLPCTRTLSCGLHRCEDTCHRGHCQPCWRTSFEEMRCRCGAAVHYPPVPCGTRAPECTLPCREVRACGHEALHACHPTPSLCPPCVVLTQRYCHGRHKMRKTIPCHQEDFSCGLPCGKDLPCGKHKCVETCHRGACPTVCSQRCSAPRPGCGHACAAPCGHAAPCPSVSPCRCVVPAACPCGRRSLQRPCHEQRAILRRVTALPGPLGEPVDMAALLGAGNTSVTLECDLECQVEDRNRRLAIGLQIRNPDLSSKLAPKYSDTLKQMAVREENFAQRVHDQLTQLVSLSRDSKQRTRSHSFTPMSRQRRQFVHELCTHFGCDSAAYDAEPYRNIVATAFKDKSWLPALSVLEVLRREKGQRKVPGPQVLPSSAPRSSAWATLGPTPPASIAPAAPTVLAPPEPPARPRIDYFDLPPED